MMAIELMRYNFDTYKNTSFKNQEGIEPYLNKKGVVKTDNNVHPLPPKGHLVRDSFTNSFKYFFKDIGYNLKSVKAGFDGNANDHQLGRLNDVGLVASGLMIATYLASKTTDAKVRLMEYIGFGVFLAAMSAYPKLVINTPAKLIHGYDIDKEYIDDQGRKKSVMQDSNYVPYDMYLGEVPEEDISKIGDKMGVPKDIVNRNDVIREQMRKVATQNNTLWMLTAGVTPVIAGLFSYGIENQVLDSPLMKFKLSRLDDSLSKMLQKTTDMASQLESGSIKSNQLSRRVESLLNTYKGKQLPKVEFENLVSLLTEFLFVNTSEAVKVDVHRILNSTAQDQEMYVVTEETLKNIKIAAENCISKNNKKLVEPILVPTKEEINTVLRRYLPANSNLELGASISSDNLALVKKDLANIIESKIQNSNTDIPKGFLKSRKTQILEKIYETVISEKSLFVSDEALQQLVDLAKVLGEFKENKNSLGKIAYTLIEDHKESVIAKSYIKFEKALIEVLGIEYKDLKKMSESEAFAKDVLDKKIAELCKDETRYKGSLEKLVKVLSEMEVDLNGKNENSSRLLDLIHAIENNYNNTAKRISQIGNFEETVNKLVKEDVKTLGTTLHSRQDLFDYLDGVIESKYKTYGEWKSLSEDVRKEYLISNTKGVGSSKRIEIDRILERYQGAKNSLNRIIHTFDIYLRAEDPETFMKTIAKHDREYVEAIINSAKEMMLSATSAEHTLKLNLVNNPTYYKDLFNSTHAAESGNKYSTKQKGLLHKITKEVLEIFNKMSHGNLLDRTQYYITRFRNIVANNPDDFTKPDHILNPYVRKSYTMDEKTRLSMFNLIGQNPVEFIKEAAGRQGSTQKWLRKVSTIVASVTGIAVLVQFFFGRLSNPQNLKKQVNYDSNK